MILQVSHLTEAFASRGRVKGGYLFDLMKFYTPPENETNSCPKEWTCLKRKCHFPTINFHWDVCFGGRYLKLIVVSVSVGISTDSLPFWKMIPEKKTKTTPCLQHILISPCFFSEKLLATLFDAWKSHFFGPRNKSKQKPGDEEFSFTVTSHWCCKPQTHAWEIPKNPATFTAEIWPIRAKVTGN